MHIGRRVTWFIVAGLIGFLVDAGVLSILIWLGSGPRGGRLISFVSAMATTWLVNRSRTFADRAGPPSLREFAHYATASSLSAAVNLGVYMALVSWAGPFRARPVLALAVSTVAAMALNFWSYWKVVFAERGDPR
jgi:putative flippase GtrA